MSWPQRGVFPSHNWGRTMVLRGGYIPPTETTEETLDHIRGAVGHRPKGFHLVVLGDLNINLQMPRNEREDGVADQCDAWDMMCMTEHFTQRRNGRTRERWTWRQERLGQWVTSKPDYLMAQTEARGCFRNVQLRDLRHHASDHRAIIAKIWEGIREKMTQYRRKVGGESFTGTASQGRSSPKGRGHD